MKLLENAPLVGDRPWGFGACAITQHEAQWTCPHCHRELKKNPAVFTYIDGDQACRDCAFEWCESHYVKPGPIPSEPIALNEQGELVLAFVA